MTRFSRPDGTLLTTESPVRVIMPYLMRGRNESIVFAETLLDVTRTLPWLRYWNEGRPEEERATMFRLFLWACGKTLHERDVVNRFISGGRIYQRNEASISFAARRELRNGSPMFVLKASFPEGEAFGDCVRRLRGVIAEGRGGSKRRLDREVALITRLPGFLIRAGVAIFMWLDRHNLMPGMMIKDDPMYSSLFATNIGSMGQDAVFHHLYEYGNTSIFASVGKVDKAVFIGADGRPEARDGMRVRWSFDERINDGFSFSKAVKLVQEIVEDPGRFVS
jgi:hypothetical protein